MLSERSHSCDYGYINSYDAETKRAVVTANGAIRRAIAEIFEKYGTGTYSMPQLISILNQATGKTQNWRILTAMLANPF